MPVVRTPQLAGKRVHLRTGDVDRRIWSDTFTGLYHVPPEKMPTPRVVLDLGASIGLTTAHYLHLWPHATVYAIEMDWDNFVMLTKNAPDAMCQWFAISWCDGEVCYRRRGVDADSYSIIGSPEGETVRSVSLSSWAEERHVDFCKMDIEGAEWDLMEKGDLSWADNVKHLLVECHDTDRSTAENVERMIGLLTNLGYNAEHHTPHPQAVFAWH